MPKPSMVSQTSGTPGSTGTTVPMTPTAISSKETPKATHIPGSKGDAHLRLQIWFEAGAAIPAPDGEARKSGRLRPTPPPEAEQPPKRTGPGRPRLGVVGREGTP